MCADAPPALRTRYGGTPFGTERHRFAHQQTRGRTALIIAAAALLGISGGTAVGYGIQSQRPPTPLPALSQPGLAYPAKPLAADKAPAPLPASEDRRVRTDGDLRKLLLERPKGAEASPDYPREGGEWMPYAEYARYFKDGEGMFRYFTESGLRRVAATEWVQKDRYTHLALVQFRPGLDSYAPDHLANQLSYMPEAKEGPATLGIRSKAPAGGATSSTPSSGRPAICPSIAPGRWQYAETS